MILVIGGDKGGTGKTTPAANFAVCLIKQGKAVTLVKIDNNNSISDWYEERQKTTRHYFLRLNVLARLRTGFNHFNPL